MAASAFGRTAGRLIAAAAITAPAAAQFSPQLVKLEAQVPMTFDHFGGSIALSGDTLVARSQVLLHVFVRSAGTWSLQTTLWPPTLFPTVGGQFGSVDLDRDTLAAGGFGTAYVIVRQGSTWSGQAVLDGTGLPPASAFGSAVAVSGDTIAVGAPGESGAGRVHVYVRSGATWTLQAVLGAIDAASGDDFGSELALEGDWLLAGAPRADPGGALDAGAAYVFLRNGTSWIQHAKLVASDASPSDSFGTSVALSGDTALVGASEHDHAGADPSGAAYVFVRSGPSWTEQQELLPGSDVWTELGSSVAVDGDRALLGAVGSSLPWAVSTGAARLFQRAAGAWSEVQELHAVDSWMHDDFGRAVELDGTTLAIGAPKKDDFGFGTPDHGPFDSNEGAVYVTGISQASAEKRHPCGLGGLPSSLKQLAGPPVLGASYAVGVDDPTNAAGLPPLATVAVLVVTFAPHSLYPCGLWTAGFGTPSGMGKELLVSPLAFGFFPPGFAFVSAPAPWAGPGTPAVFAPFLPSDAMLAGLPLFAQGAFATPVTGGLQIVLTIGIDLVLGV